MEATKTKIEGVIILTPRRFSDSRGHFSEVWNRKTMVDCGINLEFVQDNQSYSALAGTVRGLHFQTPPNAQAKLVRCSVGAILDVAVDIRKGSPTFGEHVCVELSAENGAQLMIPRGCLHGFVTLVDDCDVHYKCDGFYAPESDGTVYFADPDLAVDWGINPDQAILSEKDAAAQSFASLRNPFTYEVDA